MQTYKELVQTLKTAGKGKTVENVAQFSQSIAKIDQHLKGKASDAESGQLKFYNSLVDISYSLIRVPDHRRSEVLKRKLAELPVPETKLLSNTAVTFYSIDIERCRTLKSHAKVPIMIHVSNDESFIIKSNDSVLQDHVVILICQLFKNVF